MSRLPRRRTVSDVMTSHVHIAAPVTPFKVLVRLIEENRVSAIPIVDQQGLPIGIVSEADLLLKARRRELESSDDLLHRQKRRNERAKADATVASEVMTSPVITVAADTFGRHGTIDCLSGRTMARRGAGRFPHNPLPYHRIRIGPVDFPQRHMLCYR